MRNFKTILTTAAIGVAMLSTVSCSKDFYTKVNVNPNSPSSVPPGTLLSNVEVSLAYAQGGDASRFACLFSQQVVGQARQSASYYQYVLGPSDPEDLWDNMYTSVMENNYTLMNTAKANGYNEYYGISNILMAYSIQTVVDFWGSVPYSKALQGANGGSSYEPAYDGDAALYTTAIGLLNTGIAALENQSAGTLVPSTDDFMYGGNAASWIAFANAELARIYIHLAKHSSVAMCDSAIACVNRTGALSGGFVNAAVVFGAASTNNAPWYQFNQQRGDITFGGSFLTDSMAAISDPRLPVYVDTVASANTLGSYFGSPASPVAFITTEELDFIAAEANVRLGNMVNAQTDYTTGVTASMNEYATATPAITSGQIATYLAGSQGVLSPAHALHQVALQEYFALYLNPESWVLFRRTSSPSLVPTSGSTFPVRMIYPNSEITLNAANCPSGTSLFTPLIFWDK